MYVVVDVWWFALTAGPLSGGQLFQAASYRKPGL